MKAIVYTKYGSPDVLELREVAKPVPGEHQVLVKVHAASANALEWRRFTLPQLMVRLVMGGGLLKPKNTSIGADLAGTVEAVGAGITQFQPGDEVFGVGTGSFAEYALARENRLAPKPSSVSFEAAAAVPVAGCTALQGLRNLGQVQAGQKVLIYGAGGGVGTFAVQIAKAFGADVTAVCGPRSVEMVRSIAADRVMDYTREDFTKEAQCYDLIVPINGYHSIPAYLRALNPGGRCVVLGGSLGQIFPAMLVGRWMSKPGGKQVAVLSASVTREDLVFLGELVTAGKVVPVIDKTYPLSGARDALWYMVEGHPRGKVIIRME